MPGPDHRERVGKILAERRTGHQARQRDRVTPDIENPAAGEVIVEQPAVGMETGLETERGLDHTDLADRAGPDQFDEPGGLGMTTVHERFHQEHVMADRGLDNRLGLGVVDRERFLAEHVFAGGGGTNRPGGVRRMRRGNVDRLHGVIGQERLVTVVTPGQPERLPERVGAGL